MEDGSWRAVKKTLYGARQMSKGRRKRKENAREAKPQYLVPAHNLGLAVCTYRMLKTIGRTPAAEKGKGPVKTQLG